MTAIGLRWSGWGAAFAVALLLTACGFEPLMGKATHPKVQSEMERIRIATIPDRSGQILRNNLLDSLTPRGIQGSEAYLLVVKLSEPRRDVAIRRDDTASRISYTATATFQLYESAANRVVYSGSSQSETTFGVTNSEFATLSGLASARSRALEEVSADIREQIAAFFSGKTQRAP